MLLLFPFWFFTFVKKSVHVLFELSFERFDFEFEGFLLFFKIAFFFDDFLMNGRLSGDFLFGSSVFEDEVFFGFGLFVDVWDKVFDSEWG